MPARPPRKCSIVGDGMVTFGVPLAMTELQELEILQLDRLRVADLAGHLHHRRRKIVAAARRLEADRNPPLVFDAVELLEKIDVEIGAAELAVGDAFQAERLLELDDRRGSRGPRPRAVAAGKSCLAAAARARRAGIRTQKTADMVGAKRRNRCVVTWHLLCAESNGEAAKMRPRRIEYGPDSRPSRGLCGAIIEHAPPNIANNRRHCNHPNFFEEAYMQQRNLIKRLAAVALLAGLAGAAGAGRSSRSASSCR